MYLMGKGHEHEGPGTSMVQRIHWGEAQETQLSDTFQPDVTGRGLGSCGCKGCAKGLGLFETGFDVSGWTWAEWGIVLLGAYAAYSMLFTTRTAASAVSSGVRRTRKRLARRVAGS